MPPVTVSFRDHGYIKKAAEDFLQRYHPEDTFPIPIEEIIEFKLKLDIIPIPGLHRTFEIDGFLSSDRTSISVDEDVYREWQKRYRFTLAHEIGHLLLHKGLYSENAFKTVDEWKKFIENFPEKEYSCFEWQAYEFAGLILVPSHHLEKRARYHKKQIDSLNIQDKDVILDRTIELLSQDFVVSREVIQRRLSKESAV